MLQRSYWVYFLLFVYLTASCLASEAENSDETKGDEPSTARKRSFDLIGSDEVQLPHHETLEFLVSADNFLALGSVLKRVGLDYSHKTIQKIARLAVEYEKAEVLNLIFNSDNRLDFFNLVLSKAINLDSAFGIEYLFEKGFVATRRVIRNLVSKDAINALPALLSRIDNFSELEAQVQPASFLFHAKSGEMTTILIQARSSMTAKNDQGETALEFAFNQEKLTVVKAFPLQKRIEMLRNRLLDTAELAGHAPFVVDRDRVFEETFERISAFYSDDWFANGMEINVSFQGELLASGTDKTISGDGPFREFISLLIKDIFSPEGGLFLPLSSTSFQRAPINDDNDLKFRFAGTIVALALRENIPLGVTFIPFIQRRMLDQEVTLEDMKDHDLTFYRSIKKMMAPNYDFESAPVYFDSDPDRQVTAENFQEFLDDVIAERMVNPYLEQTEAFLTGFSERMVYFQLENLFDSDEFASVLMGRLSISAEDFIPYFAEDLDQSLQNFFLEFVENADDSTRLKIIHFTTGCIGIPVGGLESFEPRFSIAPAVHGEAHIDFMPRSSTCTHALYLPPITDYETFSINFTASLNAPSLFGLN